MSKSTISIIGIVFIAMICAISNIETLHNIILGTYRWHSVQPETVEGGLELLVVFLIFCALLLTKLNRYAAIIIFVAVAGLYLQRNQVLLPALTALAYIEGIIIIGSKLKCLFKAKNTEDPARSLEYYLNSFLVGITLWSTLALILSFLGLGSFNTLRVLTVVLVVGAIFPLRSYKLPLSVYLLGKSAQISKSAQVGFSFVSVMLLMQFAKTNRALDYDSIWYGLRPEKVLVGAHSFFDQLGLVMIVHYYPKLFEFFSIPLSDLGEYSFNSSLNVILFGLLLILVFVFLRRVSSHARINTALIAILASTPAIANMASTAKMDLFTAFFIIMGTYYLWKWFEEKDNAFICYSLAGFCLSLGGKISSFMYVPLIVFGFFVYFLYVNRKNRRNAQSGSHPVNIPVNKKWNSISIVVLSMAVFVILSIVYRTYKLTGYPLYPILGSLWSKLGFQIKYPLMGSSDDFVLNEKKELLTHWMKIIFDPTGYTHYIMVWPGNYSLLLLVAVFVIVLFQLKKREKMRSLVLFLVFSPVFISTLYYITTFPQGGDGNYYIVAIIFCVLASAFVINKGKSNLQKAILLSLLMFLPVQSFVTLISHFSWSWGTSAFAMNFTQSNFESETTKATTLRNEGLENIELYLKESKDIENCIGVVDKDGTEIVLNQLACRFEDYGHVASRFGNPELLNSKEAVLKYLQFAQTRYAIISKNAVQPNDSAFMSVVDELAANNITTRVEDSNYYLLDFHQQFSQVKK
ncbi:hypothetical protein K0T92_09905 [Paenibacillus oenotherae]|uniref:Glycosyltransferase RgtA/B/C/D-like domain-containing protein n=1 Tax=Paenibacillus oenotherae TaxID=1435645 RepID=A0ABS7D574_9BACL|nr:hypothetical protein [Paenibacillus oenotherae]MBW7475060.1 hypothetical protein [Paenibacillus oenotherae]